MSDSTSIRVGGPASGGPGAAVPVRDQRVEREAREQERTQAASAAQDEARISEQARALQAAESPPGSDDQRRVAEQRSAERQQAERAAARSEAATRLDITA